MMAFSISLSGISAIKTTPTEILPAIGHTQFLRPNDKHESQRIMKGNSIIDIIERFQSHHALQEEREMNNSHASTNGAVAPSRPEKNAPINQIISKDEQQRKSNYEN